MTALKRQEDMASPKKKKSICQKLTEVLHEKNYLTDALTYLEQETGVNKMYILFGAATFLILYLLYGYARSFVVALYGFVYPAYASVKHFQNGRKDELEDIQWFTYWIVYAAFGVADMLQDLVLRWIPLYFLEKIKGLPGSVTRDVNQ